MLVFVSIYGSRCAIGRNLVSDAKEWVVPPNVYCTRYFAADSNVSKPIGISIWTSAREKWFSYYGGNIQKPTGIFCQASWNTTPHILLQSSLLQWQLYWWIALLEESNCSLSYIVIFWSDLVVRGVVIVEEPHHPVDAKGNSHKAWHNKHLCR